MAKRLCNSNVDMIKEKVKSYGTDLVGTRKARDIANGKELPEKVVENLIKTGKIGVDMYLPFVNEIFIKEKLSFLTQLKGLILT